MVFTVTGTTNAVEKVTETTLAVKQPSGEQKEEKVKLIEAPTDVLPRISASAPKKVKPIEEDTIDKKPKRTRIKLALPPHGKPVITVHLYDKAHSYPQKKFEEEKPYLKIEYLTTGVLIKLLVPPHKP